MGFHVGRLSYKPILRVSEIDDRYVEIAKKVGLPEFNMVESKTLGIFTKERLELKLWRNESIVWKQDGLWANLYVRAFVVNHCIGN